MTLNELNNYFAELLHPEQYAADPSRNGIQIQNEDPANAPIDTVAFATDASVATAQKAIEAGAQVLFVHHGLFWGDCNTVTSIHYQRLSTFIKHNLALYACHIPLDANEIVGNNYGLARRMNLSNLKPFGVWRDMNIGVQGSFECELSVPEVIARLFPNGESPSKVFAFGKQRIRTVGIISGGAGGEVDQAAAAGLDAYITGEVGHGDFHNIKELGMTVIAGGHYNTETVGINLVREKLAKETGLKTLFIDFPTGL
ncbi:MAG: Nif3-like dinuclear metal center hexameric protein [Treponema sp.]|nr:Nif3-like dinuclear metal center hexameric protein [Treponema sp.]